ncbi:MAG: 3-isopropylmalate dehydratase large subunit [Promethearchaeota archaeon]
MGQTISEKILAAHTDDKKDVYPGEFILVKVDKCLANDITAPIAINEFRKIVEGTENGVYDTHRIILVLDHFVPNKDIKSAEQSKFVRDFAKEHQITHFYDVGRMGIEHSLLPEQGLVLPGELILGADSHTCTYGALGAFSTGVGSTDLGATMATGENWLKVPETIKFEINGRMQKWVSGKDLILYIIGKIGVDGAIYKSMEFTGSTVKNLSMDSRFTMSNMAIEAGGKNGIFTADKTTIAYMKGRTKESYKIYSSDADAEYLNTINIEAGDIEPQVAFPHLPENTKPISEVEGMRIKIDQSVIGCCTNGRLEDLREAAKVLKGNKVHPEIRGIIIPSTQQIYLDALHEGLIDIFIKSEFVVSTPTCGPCLGGYMGVLAHEEVAISTTNRNFIGRMGEKTSKVYLSNPVIAAASAVKGYICSPEELK